MATTKQPHDGHRERVYRRFLAEGLDHFEEHQALELLLFFAKPRCDTNELAHALIQRFGSFSQVMDASVKELMQVKGVGLSCAVLCKLVPAMGRFYYLSRDRSFVQINDSEDAVRFFRPRFYGLTSEQFQVAFLDDTHKVLRCMVLAEGSVNEVPVSIKKVVAEAVSSGATNVILAHNHPGGFAVPSPADCFLTQKIAQALRVLNISVTDHIVIFGDDGVSFRDSNLPLGAEDPPAFPAAASRADGRP